YYRLWCLIRKLHLGIDLMECRVVESRNVGDSLVCIIPYVQRILWARRNPVTFLLLHIEDVLNETIDDKRAGRECLPIDVKTQLRPGPCSEEVDPLCLLRVGGGGLVCDLNWQDV